MSEARELDFEPTILRLLQSEEKLQMAARARDAILAVTDRRLVVADDQRVALDIPYDSVRRVQFDIERARPATLVIVPESQGSKLDPSTRNGVGAKMGLDATRPLDADEMKFKRIRVPGEDEVDLARVVAAAPSEAWRKAIGG